MESKVDNALEELLIEQFLGKEENLDFMEPKTKRRCRTISHLLFSFEILTDDGSRQYTVTNTNTGCLINKYKNPIDFWKHFFYAQKIEAHSIKCMMNEITAL